MKKENFMSHVPRLVEGRIINSPSHGYASIITNPQQLIKIHCHSYYEIFLIAQGSGTHLINSVKIPLATGDLYFIRPNDVHCYINTTNNFKMINIILPEYEFDHLTTYLGSVFRENLLTPSLPPHASITHRDLKNITGSLEQLVLTKKILRQKSQKSDMLFRITVFNLLTTYLLSAPLLETNNTPDWLRWLSLEMLKKENFTEGLPALYRLSGKSIEHLSRACKKHLQKTPSQVVNDIRLDYAALQLQSTGRKIVEICEDSGFDNLSHFYHLFKQRYNTSPNQFRKEYQLGNVVVDSDMQIDYDASIPDALPFDFEIGRASCRERVFRAV